MGLELICDRCKAPMCAFKHHSKVNLSMELVTERVCVHCWRLESEAGALVSERVYRALGVLTAQHRGYIKDAPYRWMCGIYDNGIHQKTKALIRHDRILRGEE